MAGEIVLPGAIVGGTVINPQSAGAPAVVTGEELLRLTVWNAQAGVTIAMAWRYMQANGTHVSVSDNRLTPPSDGSGFTQTFPLGPATLFNISVRALSTGIVPGECFVRVEIVRGDPNGVPLATLISGYVGAWGGLSWPGTPLRGPAEGSGFIRVVAGGPLLLPQVDIPVASQALWRVISAEAEITTAAPVINRQAYLFIEQDSQVVLTIPANIAQPAAVTRDYRWGAGLAVYADPAGNVGLGGLPVNLYLFGAALVRFFLLNAQAGDAINEFKLIVEEWRFPTVVVA